MNAELFISDISTETAQRAYYGVSHFPERRAQSTRADYAATLAADYEIVSQQAAKGGTIELLAAEFDQYRDGYRRRYLAFLHSSARCVSWFIAGPSNFPAARMAKRADISHRRLNELVDFRARALAAMTRTLRPDLRAIYAGDGDALERLEAKISSAEALQVRMKATNTTIRRHAKEGPEAQIGALLAMGYQEDRARRLLEPDFCGRIGFPDFELTNNGANIRRMKARVEQITRLQATPAAETEGERAGGGSAGGEPRSALFPRQTGRCDAHQVEGRRISVDSYARLLAGVLQRLDREAREGLRGRRGHCNMKCRAITRDPRSRPGPCSHEAKRDGWCMVHHPDVILPKLYSKSRRLRKAYDDVNEQIAVYLEIKHAEPAIESPS